MNHGAMRAAAYSMSLALLALLAGCSDGYPRADGLSDRRMSVSAHLRVLNHYLADSSKERKLSVKDDCHLVLSKRQTAGREKVLLPLLSMDVAIDTDQKSGDFRVLLMSRKNGKSSTALRLSVKKWLDAVAWRSHFQQLQLRCAALQESEPLESS